MLINKTALYINTHTLFRNPSFFVYVRRVYNVGHLKLSIFLQQRYSFLSLYNCKNSFEKKIKSKTKQNKTHTYACMCTHTHTIIIPSSIPAHFIHPKNLSFMSVVTLNCPMLKCSNRWHKIPSLPPGSATGKNVCYLGSS